MDIDKPGRKSPKKGTATADDTPAITGNAGQYFYGHLLESCEKFFEGELEPLAFEENLRFMFGTRAYVMFTVDKVVAAIVKQVRCVPHITLLRLIPTAAPNCTAGQQVRRAPAHASS